MAPWTSSEWLLVAEPIQIALYLQFSLLVPEEIHLLLALELPDSFLLAHRILVRFELI